MTGQGTSMADALKQHDRKNSSKHGIARPLDFVNKAEAKRTAARARRG